MKPRFKILSFKRKKAQFFEKFLNFHEDVDDPDLEAELLGMVEPEPEPEPLQIEAPKTPSPIKSPTAGEGSVLTTLEQRLSQYQTETVEIRFKKSIF